MAVSLRCELLEAFLGGEAFLFTFGVFLLTVKLLCLQSLKGLIRGTSKKAPTVSKKAKIGNCKQKQLHCKQEASNCKQKSRIPF